MVGLLLVWRDWLAARMKTPLFLASFLCMLPLAAQSVGVSLAAANPLTVSVAAGGLVASDTVPAGPLTTQTSVSAWLPVGHASAQWWSNLSNYVQLQHRLGLDAGQTGSAGTAGTHEFVVTFTSAVTRNVMVEAWRNVQLTPGAPWPRVQLDIGNDGTVEVADLSVSGLTSFPVTFGPGPLEVRVVIDAGLLAPGFLENRVALYIVPDNDLDLTVIVPDCNPVLPSPPPFLGPSFEGRGIQLAMNQPLGSLAFLVFGFTPQPQFLGLNAGLPCMLLPSPDIVALAAAHPMHIALPASIRPLTFYAQGVLVSPQGVLTTAGYQVRAN